MYITRELYHRCRKYRSHSMCIRKAWVCSTSKCHLTFNVARMYTQTHTCKAHAWSLKLSYIYTYTPTHGNARNYTHLSKLLHMLTRKQAHMSNNWYKFIVSVLRYNGCNIVSFFFFSATRQQHWRWNIHFLIVSQSLPRLLYYTSTNRLWKWTMAFETHLWLQCSWCSELLRLGVWILRQQSTYM